MQPTVINQEVYPLLGKCHKMSLLCSSFHLHYPHLTAPAVQVMAGFDQPPVILGLLSPEADIPQVQLEQHP